LVFSYKGGDCTKSALQIDAVSPTREYDMRHKRAERETEREIERERERERDSRWTVIVTGTLG
jgi:hypothetical protein